MSNRPYQKGEKVESSIPNWVSYFLLALTSLFIATTIHGSVAIIAGLGLAFLFAMIYLSKPVAEIQAQKEETIFDKNKINKSSWNNPSEPNAQRRRYLNSLNDNQKRAA